MSSGSTLCLRVFIADDHVVFRQGLKALRQQKGFEIIGEASDRQTAVRMCETLHPDVAILDIAMPLLHGIDGAREVLRRCPTTAVVLLTMYAEDS